MYWTQIALPSYVVLVSYRVYLEKMALIRRLHRIVAVVTATSLALISLQIWLPGNAVAPAAQVQAVESPVVAPVPVAVAEPTPASVVAPTPPKVSTPKPAPKPSGCADFTEPSQLQEMINCWVSTHSGTFSISVRSLVKPSISAGYNSNAHVRTASIYKLHLIGVVYDRINKGQLNSSSGGIDINNCVDRMIVLSDNTCGEALGNLVGWSAADADLHAEGFPNTSMQAAGPYSSANDVADWLSRVEAGTFLTAEQKTRIISDMSRQVYRSGIPSATPGVQVANKVGFYSVWNSDAGIVFSPHGAYVVSILTQNSSFSAIADFSARVASLLNH